MKLFIIENSEFIISLVTMIVTWSVGLLCKKMKCIKNKIIPLQNALIMIIATLLYYYATGNFSAVIASSSPVATLIYDFIHMMKKESDK